MSETPIWIEAMADELSHQSNGIQAMEAALMAVAARVERETIERCRECQPVTAETPAEGNYQMGHFRGVIEYGKAISALPALYQEPER